MTPRLLVAIRQRGGCRFYGMSGMAGQLTPTHGNQCGLVLERHSPCQMEFLLNEPPDETRCPIAAKAEAEAGNDE